tara:strand:+ start:14270 stop:15139 length:870 start_codon:yes stop_codon:yes gene_type:complete
MGGELDRINPTIVEGAEDIFGAELQTHRPGSYGKRSEGHSRMTHEQVAELRKHLARRKNMKRAEQGYNDKMDESLGMRHKGRHSQSMKSRRDEASAMDKRHSKMGRKYDDVMTMDAYDDPISERQVYLIKKLGGRVGRDMNRSKASDYIKELQGKESGTWKDAESFEANDMPVSEENMVNEGSVDAVYGGGVNVAVSGDGITPTANPSVDEAFDVGNDVGIDVSEQEVMNVNPSVDAQYGDGSMSAEGNDIVETVQDLTGKVGFRINGWVASAIVVGIASMAGYHYAKR